MNYGKGWLAIMLSVLLITGSVSGPVLASEPGVQNSDAEITMEEFVEDPFDAAGDENADTSEEILETMNSQEDTDEDSPEEKAEDGMSGSSTETSDDTNEERTDVPTEPEDLSEDEPTDSISDTVYEEDDVTDISGGEIKNKEVEEDSDSIEKADDIETDDMSSEEEKPNKNTDDEEKLIEDQPDEETVSEEKSNDAFQEGDFLYTVSGNNATITGYTGSQSTLVIPDKIGDYIVTEIENQAFYGCSSVTSIRLPESITTIGYCFIQGTGITGITIPKNVTSCGKNWYGDGPLAGSSVTEVIFEDGMGKIPDNACRTSDRFTSYIEKVTIPESVTEIGYDAFYRCEYLEEIVLPKGLETIGASSFYYCRSMKSLDIPKSVSNVYWSAFQECSGLKSVKFNYNDEMVSTTNEGRQLYMLAIGSSAFRDCTSLAQVVLTENVVEIGDEAFYGCSKLEELILPERVKSLGSCFIQGTGIASITIPKNVTSCGKNWYGDGPLAGSSVTEVIFEEGMGKIPDNACRTSDRFTSYIEKVTIPESVTEIGYDAFNRCEYLEEIILPKGLETIGASSFYYCRSMKSLDIPKSVSSVYWSAFEECSGLKSVKFNYNDEMVNTTNEGRQLYMLAIGSSAFRDCTSLAQVVLTENVVEIGDEAFYGCSKLEELILPERVKSLGSCFIQGTGIASITIPKNVTSCGKNWYGDGPLAGSSVTEVIFENGMKEVPAYICSTSSNYNSKISKVVIPASVNSIGNDAFFGCDYVLLTIYGYAGSYAELYAREHNINFKYVSINKDATEDDILGMFDIDAFLKDVTFGDTDNIEGPKISFNGKEFNLFSLDAAGLKVSVTDHVQVSVNPESKTVRLLIGYKPISESSVIDPGGSPSGSAGTKKRKDAWNKEFNDFKSLYRSVAGGNASDEQIASKLKAINNKLYDSNATIGLSASGKVAGYMEISYASGEFYLKEGGVIVSTNVSASFSKPFTGFPAAYVAFSASLDFNGTMRFVKITTGYTPELAADLALALQLGLGFGSHRAKTYVEGGLKGTLKVGLNYPADTLPKAMKVKLSGDLYISSSLFGFEGPGYSHTFASAQLYPKVGDDVITYSADAASAMVEMERDYLENVEATPAMMGAVDEETGSESLYMDTRVYPYNNAQIATLPDGNKLMVWVGDDGTKTGINRTSIMYAVYDGDDWSETGLIGETGGMNDYPVLYQKDDAVYIVWQKAVKIFGDDVDLTEVLENVDIYYAVYKNGTMSGVTAVTSGSTYEMMQQMAVDGDNVYVAWVENSANDVYMTEGTTSLRLAAQKDGKWTTKTIYSGSNDINNVVMDIVDGKLCLVYELGTVEEDDYIVNLYLYKDGSNRKIASDAQNALFCGGRIYYVSDTALEIYDISKGQKTSTGLDGISDYEIVENSLMTHVVVNRSDGYTGELYAYSYNHRTGEWNDGIQLTHFGKYIRSFSVTADSDGTLMVALNLVTVNDSEDNSNRYGDAVLQVVKAGEVPDLTVDPVAVFDAAAVSPGADLPVSVNVTNNSLSSVNSLTISLYDKNGIKVESSDMETVIEAGESAMIQYLYTLPDKLSKHAITLEVTARGEDNVGDNRASAVIGMADLRVESAYLSGSASEPSIVGNIENRGYETAKNITVELIDGNDSDKVLDAKTIGTMAAGKSETVTFDIDKGYMDVNPLASGNTLDVHVSCETEEADYSNNDAQVLIRSQADAAIALNRESVELQKGKEASLRVTYIAAGGSGAVVWTSSNESVATVDQDGLVTAVENGNTIITARMGNHTAECAVYVLAPSVKGIYLSENAATMKEGDTRALTASLIPSTVDAEVLWTSSNLSVAEVSENGVVTAVRAGKAVITAQSGPASAECTITVYGTGEIDTGLTNISVCSIEVEEGNIIYDGKEHEPSVTVKNGEAILTENTDYKITYEDNTNAGEARIIIVGIGDYTGSVVKTFKIAKAAQELNVSISNTVLKPGNTTTITAEGIGSLTYASSDENVAVVNSRGRVVAMDFGKAVITVTASGDQNHYAASKEIEIEVTGGMEEKKDLSACSVELLDKELVYDGSEKKPAFSVRDGSITLTQNKDFTAEFSDNTNAGTATLTITGMGNYEGTKTVTFTIGKANQSVTASNLSLTYPKGGKITVSGNMGTLSYMSLNTAIATVDAYGNVTAKGAGTAKIRITASEVDNYNEAVKEITVTVAKGNQTISAKSSAASVAVGKKVTVSATGAHGKVTYKSSDTSVATVNAFTGAVTAKKVGAVKITATAAETEDYNAASAKVTIKVVPAATTSLTAENQAKGIKLTWKKVTGATGFLVYRGSSKIATIGKGTTLTYTDAKAKTNGAKYTYKVIATASTGNSTLSKSLTTHYVAAPTAKTAKSTMAKKADVTWGKNEKATGYEIEYSLKKSFSGAKKTTITKKAVVKTTLTGLSAGKKYYVRIRTYMKNGSNKYYSAWSKAKEVIIKR